MNPVECVWRYLEASRYARKRTVAATHICNKVPRIDLQIMWSLLMGFITCVDNLRP